jgi:hypothetical protein
MVDLAELKCKPVTLTEMARLFRVSERHRMMAMLPDLQFGPISSDTVSAAVAHSLV